MSFTPTPVSFNALLEFFSPFLRSPRGLCRVFFRHIQVTVERARRLNLLRLLVRKTRVVDHANAKHRPCPGSCLVRLMRLLRERAHWSRRLQLQFLSTWDW